MEWNATVAGVFGAHRAYAAWRLARAGRRPRMAATVSIPSALPFCILIASQIRDADADTVAIASLVVHVFGCVAYPARCAWSADAAPREGLMRCIVGGAAMIAPAIADLLVDRKPEGTCIIASAILSAALFEIPRSERVAPGGGGGGGGGGGAGGPKGTAGGVPDPPGSVAVEIPPEAPGPHALAIAPDGRAAVVLFGAP